MYVVFLEYFIQELRGKRNDYSVVYNVLFLLTTLDMQSQDVPAIKLNHFVLLN